MLKFTLIFLASGLGGLLRYGLGGLMQAWWDRAPAGAQPAGGLSGGFPIGTLTVNTSGCLAIGFLAAAFAGSLQVRPEYQVAVLVGLLGGYTTFSAFGRETLSLTHDGEWVRAGMYVLLTNMLGLAAVWAGHAFGSRWFQAQAV